MAEELQPISCEDSHNDNPASENAANEMAIGENSADALRRGACCGGTRRGFFTKCLAGLIGALVGIVPASIGGLFFLDPLLRRLSGGGGDEHAFVPMGIGPDALPASGTPQRFTVLADKVDAWNMFPNQPIGSVWLRRAGDQVIAFNTICPHLGCGIEHRAAEQDFYCPCHTSVFSLDGEKQNAIPPRNMDQLTVEIRDGQIYVQFINYRGVEKEQIPV